MALQFPNYFPKGFITNLIGGKLRDVGSAASPANYDANKGLDLSAYGVKDKQASDFDPSSDPIYQLELERANALYPTGGGDGGLGRALAQAAAQYAYGGPSIDQINQFGREGQSRIANLYAQLDQYLQGQKGETAGNYNAAQMRAAAAYQNAGKDIAAAQQAVNQNLAQQGQLGGTAGAGAAQQATQAADAAIQRQAALNQTNQANAMSSFQQLGTGHQAILGDLAVGMQRERGAQSGKLSDQISGMVQQAIREMDIAKTRTAMAQQEIRDKYAQQQQEAAGKNQAAKLKALEDAITRNEKSQKDEKFSGIQGVLAYAMKQGKPELAQKFMDLLGASRIQAANINKRAQMDTSGMTKSTTPEIELQNLLGNVGLGRQDLSTDIDPRGDILNQIRTNPKLSALRQFIISTPEQARRVGEYVPAFGMDRGAYEKQMNPQKTSASMIFSKSPKFNPQGGSAFEQQMNQRFTPFVNLTALRQNPMAVKQYYNQFDSGDQDFLMRLYDIFGGRYGQGSF